MAREDAGSERAHQVRSILTAADERDERAEARDSASGKRDMAANLEDWLNNSDDDEASEARRLASDDRTHARRDRTTSKSDRHNLADDDTASPVRDRERVRPRCREWRQRQRVGGRAGVEHGPVHRQFTAHSVRHRVSVTGQCDGVTFQSRQQPPVLRCRHPPQRSLRSVPAQAWTELCSPLEATPSGRATARGSCRASRLWDSLRNRPSPRLTIAAAAPWGTASQALTSHTHDCAPRPRPGPRLVGPCRLRRCAGRGPLSAPGSHRRRRTPYGSSRSPRPTCSSMSATSPSTTRRSA